MIRNPKYKANKKNGGIIPAIRDERVLYVPIKCGKCMECKKQKSNEWKSRLMEDIKTNTNATFVTLTFSEDQLTKLYQEHKDKLNGYALDNWTATRAVRKFLERWRKKHGKSLRHWLVTELGHNGTERIHLHGLLWSRDEKEILKTWGYGYVYFGTWVNEQTVNYIVKYLTKTDPKHPNYQSIMLTSAGIGNNYTNTHNAKLNKYLNAGEMPAYITKAGTKSSLPTYWKNKLYTDEEKENLWIELLNKQERWVDGTKYNIENDEYEYKKALEEARRKNKILGYKGNDKDRNDELYEQHKRQIKIITRKNKNKKEPPAE